MTAKAADLARAADVPKTKLLYVNFRPETNPQVRGPLWEAFSSKAWGESVTREARSPSIEAYARNLAGHRFVLCPRGSGVETHRMWESLYVGSIPVVEDNVVFDSFRDLPILFVKDLRSLERGFLEKAFEEIRGRAWNVEKLFLPYWKNAFEEACRSIGPRLGWGEFAKLRARALLAAVGLAAPLIPPQKSSQERK